MVNRERSRAWSVVSVAMVLGSEVVKRTRGEGNYEGKLTRPRVEAVGRFDLATVQLQIRRGGKLEKPSTAPALAFPHIFFHTPFYRSGKLDRPNPRLRGCSNQSPRSTPRLTPGLTRRRRARGQSTTPAAGAPSPLVFGSQVPSAPGRPVDTPAPGWARQAAVRSVGRASPETGISYRVTQ